MSSVPTSSSPPSAVFDPFDPAHLADPYPAYQALRTPTLSITTSVTALGPPGILRRATRMSTPPHRRTSFHAV